MRYGDIYTVEVLAEEIVNKYTRVLSTPSTSETSDQVLNYVCELITLGMLWHHYHDAVCEGDGNRVLLTWKFLLIVFKAAKEPTTAKKLLYY